MSGAPSVSFNIFTIHVPINPCINGELLAVRAQRTLTRESLYNIIVLATKEYTIPGGQNAKVDDYVLSLEQIFVNTNHKDGIHIQAVWADDEDDFVFRFVNALRLASLLEVKYKPVVPPSPPPSSSYGPIVVVGAIVLVVAMSAIMMTEKHHTPI